MADFLVHSFTKQVSSSDNLNRNEGGSDKTMNWKLSYRILINLLLLTGICEMNNAF